MGPRDYFRARCRPHSTRDTKHVSVSVAHSSHFRQRECVTCPFQLSWLLLVRGTPPLETSPNAPSHHVAVPAVLRNILESCTVN